MSVFVLNLNCDVNVSIASNTTIIMDSGMVVQSILDDQQDFWVSLFVSY